jgi:hypothetical protein
MSDFSEQALIDVALNIIVRQQREIAEAFRAGRIAQAEEDARIADNNAAVARFWEGQSINYAVAAAIRANAAKLANESTPPSSARAERGK